MSQPGRDATFGQSPLQRRSSFSNPVTAVAFGGYGRQFPYHPGPVPRWPSAVTDNPRMALFTLTNAHLAFGHVALLDHTDFALEAGERVGLIGRNGTG
jgi:ABC-type multidrug transport system fused ATPase/permease subunit